jgi:phage shock protein C
MEKFYRSTSDKWLAGVFGGFAESLDIDPNLVRLPAIFLGIATGIIPMLITYLVPGAWSPKGSPSSN